MENNNKKNSMKIFDVIMIIIGIVIHLAMLIFVAGISIQTAIRWYSGYFIEETLFVQYTLVPLFIISGLIISILAIAFLRMLVSILIDIIKEKKEGKTNETK